MTPKTNEAILSMEVSQMIGKDHHKLLRDIRRYLKQLGEIKTDFSDFFQESTYITTQNKEFPCYIVSRKGCDFIVNKLTGQKGTEFTARYVNRFHENEANFGLVEYLEEMNTSNTFPATLGAISQSLFDMKDDFEDRIADLYF